MNRGVLKLNYLSFSSPVFISRIIQYKAGLLMTILHKHELLRSGWTTVQTFMAGNHAITTHSRCTYMAIWLCTSCHLFRWHFACSQIGQTCAKSNCSRWLHCKTLQVVPILYKVSLLDTTLTLCYILWTYLYTAVIRNRKRLCAHPNSFYC